MGLADAFAAVHAALESAGADDAKLAALQAEVDAMRAAGGTTTADEANIADLESRVSALEAGVQSLAPAPAANIGNDSGAAPLATPAPVAPSADGSSGVLTTAEHIAIMNAGQPAQPASPPAALPAEPAPVEPAAPVTEPSAEQEGQSS